MLFYTDIERLCQDNALFTRVVTEAKVTPDEATQIGAAYRLIFKREIRQTCGNCVGDALIELRILYKQNPEQMKEQFKCNYALKAGAMINLEFGGPYYTNANLTDEVAEKYLKAFPDQLEVKFQKWPVGAKAKAKEAEPEAEPEAPEAESPAGETEPEAETPAEETEEAPEAESPAGETEPAKATKKNKK